MDIEFKIGYGLRTKNLFGARANLDPGPLGPGPGTQDPGTRGLRASGPGDLGTDIDSFCSELETSVLFRPWVPPTNIPCRGWGPFMRFGAGPSLEQLCCPMGMAVHEGCLYIADAGNHRIMKLTPGRSSAEVFLTHWDPIGSQ